MGDFEAAGSAKATLGIAGSSENDGVKFNKGIRADDQYPAASIRAGAISLAQVIQTGRVYTYLKRNVTETYYPAGE